MVKVFYHKNVNKSLLSLKRECKPCPMTSVQVYSTEHAPYSIIRYLVLPNSPKFTQCILISVCRCKKSLTSNKRLNVLEKTEQQESLKTQEF